MCGRLWPVFSKIPRLISTYSQPRRSKSSARNLRWSKRSASRKRCSTSAYRKTPPSRTNSSNPRCTSSSSRTRPEQPSWWHDPVARWNRRQLPRTPRLTELRRLTVSKNRWRVAKAAVA
uniref:(northern house mosquito) hypothetical protein n=1 Tax=Culex pipiens TaxID=7175 RepID=A0A8D8JSF9_CULPI